MLEKRQNKSSMSFRVKTRSLLSIIIILICASSFSQVSSTIDTTQIRIGEEIIYTIQVEADTTDLVMFPEGQTFSPLEVIESYKIDTTRLQDKIQLIKKYGLTQFDSGSYTIPTQRIVINNNPFNTDSLKIEVANVVVDTLQQKMYHIKPAFDIADPLFNFKNLLFTLLGLLVLLGIVLYFYFRRKKKRKEAEQILPPYEEALEALKELDSSHFLKNDNSKKYYSALTEIIKRYLHREVDDSALESTSNELIERLILHRNAGNFEFDADTINKLESIFKRADLIKFAKMKEQEGQAKVDRSVVEEIINETKEIIPEPTEEELLKNEAYLEEMAKLNKRKKIKKTISIAFTVALVTISTNIALQGWDKVRDGVFGNDMKDLVEGRWYKSEYGIPAVIIETPKILVRKDIPIPEEQKDIVMSFESFEYGSFSDAFYITVNTSVFNPEIMEDQDLDLEISLEGGLKGIENSGAINLVVKKEEFSTEKGIKGLKAHGDFDMKLPNGVISDVKIAYEILLFKQNKGLQIVSIIYKKEDDYAIKIKERVIKSIELEVTEQKKKDGQ